MKIKIRFSHIDVTSIVKSDKKENEISFISKLKSQAAKSAIKHAPSVVESIIEKKIKDIINEYDIAVELETTVLLKKANSDELYGIAFSVSKVDYVSIFHALKPFILDTNNDIFSELLSIIGDDCDNVIKAVISSLDDDKKAKTISVLVRRFNKKICDLLNKAAKNKGIDVVIDKITVSH